MPKVTVLMPVLDSSTYLHASIISILNQSYRDFQFLIIDDGSRDGGQDIVRSFDDPRIRFLQNDSNQGVAATLNKGMALAESKYIVRMDADDVSQRQRLAIQVEKMERDHELDICGSWVRMIDEGGKGQVIRYPTQARLIKPYILFNNPLAHPSVIMRKSTLLRNGLRYDEGVGAGQDYEFWARCVECCRIKNIPKPLLLWRRHHQGVTVKDSGNSNATALLVQRQALLRLGVDCDSGDLEGHRSIGQSRGKTSRHKLEEALSWLTRILVLNRSSQRYEPAALREVIAMIWYRLCMTSAANQVPVLKTYLSAPFRFAYRPYPIELAVLSYHSLATMFCTKSRA